MLTAFDLPSLALELSKLALSLMHQVNLFIYTRKPQKQQEILV